MSTSSAGLPPGRMRWNNKHNRGFPHGKHRLHLRKKSIMRQPCSPMNLRPSPCRVPLPSALYHSFLNWNFVPVPSHKMPRKVRPQWSFPPGPLFCCAISAPRPTIKKVPDVGTHQLAGFALVVLVVAAVNHSMSLYRPILAGLWM